MKSLSASVLAIWCVTTAAWSEVQDISWDMLSPEPPVYDNPFADLSAEQMDGLRNLLRMQMRAESLDEPIDEGAVDLRASLESDGLDVDGLFAQRLEIMEKRQAAARAPNQSLIGEPVRLPGYVLPLEMKDHKVTEFLLVPTIGACIHTPTPPANQMVHVVYPNGLEVSGLYDPVWIKGNLKSDYSEQLVRYYDGDTTVAVTYSMQPDEIQSYE